MLSPDEVQACWQELREIHAGELRWLKSGQKSERGDFLEEMSTAYLTASQAATVLNIDVDEVRTLCRMKILVGVKLSGVGWLMTHNSLDRARHIISGEVPWDVAEELS